MKKLGMGLMIYAVLLAAAVAADQGHQHDMSDSEQEKFGTVNFPTSCSAAVQGSFARAVAMLHSFGYEESGKAFAEVAGADPTCSMAHWGIAMSLYHPLWDKPSAAALEQGRAEMQKATALAAKTERERDYIAALSTFYKDPDKLDHATRAMTYETAMQHVYKSYPEDREASIFYALSLLGTAIALPPDKSYVRQKMAGAILEKIFAEQPDHPGVAHYLIHSYDYPSLADRALPAARSYAKIAPSSPHAQHMPSHIFTRLGYWQDSINSNLGAEAAAKQLWLKAHSPGAQHQELHAMDYLEYAYLQSGQMSQAKAVYEESKTVQRLPSEMQAAAFAFAAIPARYTIERHDWRKAAALRVDPTPFPWTDAIIHWARAVGSARTGDVEGATRAIADLRAARERIVSMKETYWADQVDIQLQEAGAWVEHARHNDDKALTMLRAAAAHEDATEKDPVTPGWIVPAHEMVGELLLGMHRPAEALNEFATSLETSPNRFNGIYGAARSARLAGNQEKSRLYYSKLTKLCGPSKDDLPEVREAQGFLGKKMAGISSQ